MTAIAQKRFRFGVANETIRAPAGLIDHVRRVEDLGYSTFLIRDHFIPDFFGEQLAPFPTLAAAAAATTELRVGTLVIDNDYRHPVMLAKEAATVDYLSGGRLELGIGAGWLRKEYEAAGMPFDRAGTRIDRLEEAIQVINSMFYDDEANFSGDHYQVRGIRNAPRPAQRPRPPLLIGGGKPRMLRLAGREADIVSLLTTSVAGGTPEDAATERLAAAVEQKLEWIREGAGDRYPSIELNLIPTIVFTDDRERVAQALIGERGWEASVSDVLEMPSIFIGSLGEIVEQMVQRRDRYGFSYYVIGDSRTEEIAPIVAELAGR